MNWTALEALSDGELWALYEMARERYAVVAGGVEVMKAALFELMRRGMVRVSRERPEPVTRVEFK